MIVTVKKTYFQKQKPTTVIFQNICAALGNAREQNIALQLYYNRAVAWLREIYLVHHLLTYHSLSTVYRTKCYLLNYQHIVFDNS